tara:strand:+ start:227 stop:448 length:222 start_codon:yes stop_codon:yes gene_type:complete
MPEIMDVQILTEDLHQLVKSDEKASLKVVNIALHRQMKQHLETIEQLKKELKALKLDSANGSQDITKSSEVSV